MNRLIEAFEQFFAAAAGSGGKLAETAGFALEHLPWSAPPGRHEPLGNPVVDAYLATACTSAGATGSSTRPIAAALLASADQLHWRARLRDEAPDLAVFSRNFTAVTVIGPGGLLASDKVMTGFSLQAPDTYYPPHAHLAEESYWIIGGDGDWKVDVRPWFAVKPGDSIYHASGARHAMQTNEQPLLSIWLWTSHLDSEVVIVRG